MIETTLKGKATIYSGKRISHFTPTGIEVGKMNVYRDQSKKVLEILEENRKNIQKIGEKHNADVMISCSHRFFKHIVTNTEKHEIEINLFITNDRKIVHYAIVGFEPTVLLMAVDE